MPDPESAPGRATGPGEKMPHTLIGSDPRRLAPRAVELHPLLGPREVQNLLRISARKLWSLTASGEVPSLRIGRCVRYDLADIQRWLNERKREGGVGR